MLPTYQEDTGNREGLSIDPEFNESLDSFGEKSLDKVKCHAESTNIDFFTFITVFVFTFEKNLGALFIQIIYF